MYIVKPTCCHISCQNAIQFDYRAVSSLKDEIRIRLNLQPLRHNQDPLNIVPSNTSNRIAHTLRQLKNSRLAGHELTGNE